MGAEPALVRASVVRAYAGRSSRVEIQVPAGATLRDAIVAAGLLSLAELTCDAPPVGVFGEIRSLDAKIADGDRIEIYRPLTIDPKEARRLRAALRKKQLR